MVEQVRLLVVGCRSSTPPLSQLCSLTCLAPQIHRCRKSPSIPNLSGIRVVVVVVVGVGGGGGGGRGGGRIEEEDGGKAWADCVIELSGTLTNRSR